MRFEPGSLVEIVSTTDTAPDGTDIEPLADEYMGKLALIISYDENKQIYSVLVGNDEKTEVYEEEIVLI